MAVVYIALGTNLGDREQNLRRAEQLLGSGVAITGRSTVYETEPWGVADQPRFLNQVIRGETALEPEELLAFCKSIEHEMGRIPTVRYGPRLIDLDILLYDDRVIETERLQIPHPRLGERRFVLVPLEELALDLVHPVLGIPIRALLRQLPDDGSVRPYRPSRKRD